MSDPDDGYRFRFDPDHLTALGRMTMNASYLESTVRVMLWRLLGSGKAVGERMTADATFRWLVDRCRVLAEHRLDGQPLEDIRSWLGRAVSAYARRSKIVHSEWYVDVTDRKARFGYSRSTARKPSFEAVGELATAHAIHEIARELERIGLEGVSLMKPVIDKFGDLGE